MTNVASNSPAAKAETSHRDEANRAQRDRCEDSRIDHELGTGDACGGGQASSGR